MAMATTTAGTIARVKVENFMCHGNLVIELIDNVNFITGQNGSGKSAILTALCVAFGCKARETQRASSLKDFIKTGCNHASVVVEMKNEGPEAFKPEVYGNMIVIERRITHSSTTTVLKDVNGRKVASRREELHELIEHFNIDVENPCVIMSQDKSREFLHSGNDREKFRFFYKATLLQQVADLLDANQKNIEACQELLKKNEDVFRPFQETIDKLDEEIRRALEVDQMEEEVTKLRKRLAWSFVEEADHNIEVALQELKKYKDRIPICQQKIDAAKAAMEAKMQEHSEIEQSVRTLMGRSDQVKASVDALSEELSQVTREKARLEEQFRCKSRALHAKVQTKSRLEQEASEMRKKFLKNTEEEANQRTESLNALERQIASMEEESKCLEGEMESIAVQIRSASEEITRLNSEIEDQTRRRREVQQFVHRLRNQQSNKVTAFGGEQVLRLLRSVENAHRRFSRPPIGPLGAHLALSGDKTWAFAVEIAVGKLFNAFIVDNHADMMVLRKLAQECGYKKLQIIIYDFSYPMLNLPQHKLPDLSLTTVLSVLQMDVVTVRNVLIEVGGAERQVLAKDYDEGKHVAFDRRRHPNVQEVLTTAGERMFSRGGSETTLNPDRKFQEGRLDVGLDERIARNNREVEELGRLLGAAASRKRSAEETVRELRRGQEGVKRRKMEVERRISQMRLTMRDIRADAAEAEGILPNMEELEQEIQIVDADISTLQQAATGLETQLSEVRERHRNSQARYESLLEETRGDVEACDAALVRLHSVEEEVGKATNDFDHYTRIMEQNVVANIAAKEESVKKLQEEREETSAKASQICPEEEVRALGGAKETPHRLSVELKRFQDRVAKAKSNVKPAHQLQEEKLRVEKKIRKKQNIHNQLKYKVQTIADIYQKRRTKFDRNSCFLRRQLKWQFNGHLQKKAMSGQVHIDYEAKTLKLEVLMPQDASNAAVEDTRALSGGERSFSTLCFALALHEMTEAPFRAMDEFDVFMDQISRKLSLEKVVEFAIAQGSQWIFITPHDISSVKPHPKLKKQQMTAPRP